MTGTPNEAIEPSMKIKTEERERERERERDDSYNVREHESQA